MPDWSYRTVFRPLLFRLPFSLARNLALGSMGLLSRLPLGGAVIDFLGHMRPDPRLRTDLGPLTLASPVVIGPYLDPGLLATAALSRFGVGMIEMGPAGPAAEGDHSRVRRDDVGQCLSYPDPLPLLGAAGKELDRLSRSSPAVPLLIRIAPPRGSNPENTTFLSDLALLLLPEVRVALTLATFEQTVAETWPLDDWRKHLGSIFHALGEAGMPSQPLFVAMPADIDLSRGTAYLQAALECGVCGFIVDGRTRNSGGGWLVGATALQSSLVTVRRLREEIHAQVPLIAGGADDPHTALQLLKAGANAVQIDAALAFAGPGLPKRINDAVLFAKVAGTLRVPSTPLAPASPSEPPHAAAMSWFWALLLGIAMLLGGTMALSFAATRVLLPYDEAYLGMTADELTAKIPRLLAFMAHDRVTLAGTMLAVGIQYMFLAWFGIRRGLHWAKLTVVVSAFAGFLTFFLFLGFGYFDPLHAFVTAILFQFLLLAFQGRLAQAQPTACPNLRDDWRWRLANWGQLLLVIQGAAIITAGVTISSVGITTVFVHEDLEFMETTLETLRTANPRLIPVIAHDRASFGGMLISVGVATLLPALWGIRQGERWLWWMLALAGTVAYDATLIIHLHVGYTDWLHLTPAFGGLALLWLALGLLLPYLVLSNPHHQTDWAALVGSPLR